MSQQLKDGDTGSFDETAPLLSPAITNSYTQGPDGSAVQRDDLHARNGESFDDIPQEKRQLGVWSAVFLIFNRIIGTGIYATPSLILRASGSVGVSFIMWILGASFAAIGSAVFVELGTGLPRNGGEKNYLEFIYRHPKFLVSCTFSLYAIIMGSNAANSLVFGEYVVHTLGHEPTRFNTQFIGILCILTCLVVHGIFLKFGIQLQNSLGIFKLFVLSSIALCGLFVLLGIPGFEIQQGYEVPDNFTWDKFWEGSGTGANAFVMGLYNVIWSFIGYSNANYALSEVKDPVKTLKRASPIAILSVTVVYLLVNVAYYAVVSKTDILEGKRIVAALFFRNLFGPVTERFLSGIIALSILGNVLSVGFSQSRLIQEFGREGIFPHSEFFASNKPFNAPLAALFVQAVVSILIMVAPPPGDAYLFMLSLPTYASAVINLLVGVGLLLLHTPAYRAWDWNPPFKAPKLVVVLFVISNLFLAVIPLIPPSEKDRMYERLPYWSHVVVSYAMSLLGVAYWYVWSRWLPRRHGYRLERKWVLQDDGVSRSVFHRVPIEE